MKTYQGKTVFLREMNLEDASLILDWENDPKNSLYSDFDGPYIIEDIEQLIIDSPKINDNKQVRLLICERESLSPIGTIDLFEIDEIRKQAGVGILVADDEKKRKGFALQALSLIEDFALNELNLSLLFCTINSKNIASLQLFKKAGYLKMSKGRDINIDSDVYFYQKKLV